MSKRIFVFGASGAGTSSIGKSIANALCMAHYDTDTYYWLDTDPPFQQRRELSERLSLLQSVLTPDKSWVLSGSLDGWGDPLIPLFDILVFVTVDPDVRMSRLQSRERERYGASIEPEGALHKASKQFLEWTASYDKGDLPGRSRARHEQWLASKISAPVIRVDNTRPLSESLDYVITKLSGITE